MKRRTALQAIAALGLSPGFAYGRDGDVSDFGGRKNPNPTAKPLRKNHPWIAGAGKNSNVFLWKFYEHVAQTPFIPHYQLKDGDGLGDCVGQATAAAVDMLMASEIVLLKQPEKWVAKASIEAIYGGGRIEIGQDLHDRNYVSPNGMLVDYAIEYVKAYGILHRINYATQGHDLREYSIPRCREWAMSGVPDELEPLAKQHPVQQHSNVKDFDALSDAIAAGQPVIIGSTYAVKDTRDGEGFGELYTGGGTYYRRGRFWSIARTKWYHCMAFIGIRNGTDRPGALLLNSHGPNWISGPKSFGQPEGSCWLTPEHVNLMLGDWDEGYAISAYKGHPGSRIEKIKKHRLF